MPQLTTTTMFDVINSIATLEFRIDGALVTDYIYTNGRITTSPKAPTVVDLRDFVTAINDLRRWYQDATETLNISIGNKTLMPYKVELERNRTMSQMTITIDGVINFKLTWDKATNKVATSARNAIDFSTHDFLHWLRILDRYIESCNEVIIQ